MRDPFLAISNTAAGPPTRTVPWMKMATKPANMTKIWNTSVQITAFMPPWYKLWRRHREKHNTTVETRTKNGFKARFSFFLNFYCFICLSFSNFSSFTSSISLARLLQYFHTLKKLQQYFVWLKRFNLVSLELLDTSSTSEVSMRPWSW